MWWKTGGFPRLSKDLSKGLPKVSLSVKVRERGPTYSVVVPRGPSLCVFMELRGVHLTGLCFFHLPCCVPNRGYVYVWQRMDACRIVCLAQP
jgi:hypothetical protein